MSDENDPKTERAPSEPVIFILSKPVSIEVKTGNGPRTKTVEQLTIRPPKGKDLRRIDRTKSPIAISLDMASWLTGEPTQIIDELEGTDLREVLKIVDGFFVAIQSSGDTSSGA
jgi:hypothetical protein